MKGLMRLCTLFLSLLLIFSFSVSAVTQYHIPSSQVHISEADKEAAVTPFTEEEIQTMKKIMR